MNKIKQRLKAYKKAILTISSAIALSFLFITFTSTLTLKPKPAEAGCCGGCCTCWFKTVPEDLMGWGQDIIEINTHLLMQLKKGRLDWWDFTFWQRYMLPSMMQMGNQLASIGMQQVMSIGMFFDAKEQLERQRLLQELHTRANKDYHPSIGMCEFGSRIKSLAASERKGEMNAVLLSKRSTDRYFNNKDTGAAAGQSGDITLRLNAFQKHFCNSHDNGGSLAFICPDIAASSNPSQAQRNRLNKDIDYQRTVETPWTINFDLTQNGAPSEADEEIIALKNNLYGYDGFNNADYKALQNTNRALSDIQSAYLSMRAATAKTKVAENSFNALMALKGAGTEGSKEFIAAYLKELGTPEKEINDFLGANPSYHAQMEVLTKKAYQSPEFYTNLYDKPANIERKAVAMQAVGLIQKFDLLKSHLRTEASLSVLLELSVENLQRETEDNIQAFARGKR